MDFQIEWGWICCPSCIHRVAYYLTGQSGDTRRFLHATADILRILTVIGFLWKLLQLVLKGWNFVRNLDNFFLLLLCTLTFIFILGFDNVCWCSTTWQWQTGAVTVFLSWFNLILILKYMPYTAVPINMFLSICVTFLKLIYLPVMLVLAFGMPYYMVLVRKAASSEVSYWIMYITACLLTEL